MSLKSFTFAVALASHPSGFSYNLSLHYGNRAKLILKDQWGVTFTKTLLGLILFAGPSLRVFILIQNAFRQDITLIIFDNC